MKEIYVGHEVICKYRFVRHAYAHDLIGCHFEEKYYIRREYTILEKIKNGEYVYLNTKEKSTILSYEDIKDNTDKLINCYECDKAYKMGQSDCEEIADIEERVIGIIDIERIEEVAKNTDKRRCIEIINEYNELLENQQVKAKIRKLQK